MNTSPENASSSIDSVSVIVPVFNGATTLPELTDRILKVFSGKGREFEIVFVNDGSADNSWTVICELAQAHDCVVGLNFMRNYGQHDALLAGIRAARFGVIVTIDDDLQHPPEVIPSLLHKLEEGYDVVYGTPEKEQHGLLRDIASVVTKLTLRDAVGIDIAPQTSSFRAFRSAVRRAFADYCGPFVDIDALLSWGTSSFGAVRVRHDPRRDGRSSYTFRKLVGYTINMMTCFSIVPLRVASLIGFIFSLFGFGVLVYVLVRFFIEGGSVPGFPFLASIITLFSGAQLVSLGVIGEYLARMHFRSMGRPTGVIRDTTGVYAPKPYGCEFPQDS